MMDPVVVVAICTCSDPQHPEPSCPCRSLPPHPIADDMPDRKIAQVCLNTVATSARSCHHPDCGGPPTGPPDCAAHQRELDSSMDQLAQGCLCDHLKSSLIFFFCSSEGNLLILQAERGGEEATHFVLENSHCSNLSMLSIFFFFLFLP